MRVWGARGVRGRRREGTSNEQRWIISNYNPMRTVIETSGEVSVLSCFRAVMSSSVCVGMCGCVDMRVYVYDETEPQLTSLSTMKRDDRGILGSKAD